MGWFALEVRDELEVLRDLQRASVAVERPTYKVESWNPRKSVRVVREFSLLGGYLLVDRPSLPDGATHRWHRFLTGASGAPTEVVDADDVILRARTGEYDVVLARTRRFCPADRVLVILLGLFGSISRVLRNWQYIVRLDVGRDVRVPHSGLSLAARGA